MYTQIEIYKGKSGVEAIFSDRNGGVSNLPKNSLNLGFNTSDDIKNVLKNYKIICDELNVNFENLVFSNQVHKDKVMRVKKGDKDLKEVDGLITDDKGVILVTLYADCVPIYIYDPINEAIGLCHSGWKGTVMKIAKKTIDKMKEEFNTNPKDLIVAIGPSIGPDNFEVGEEVVLEFKKHFKSNHFMKKDNSKYLLNLWSYNKDILIESGVLKENIGMSKICTYKNVDKYFSYRKEAGKTGRMAAMMYLKAKTQ